MNKKMNSFSIKFFICFLLIIVTPYGIHAQKGSPLSSGFPIKAGGDKGIASMFLNGEPLGSAFVGKTEFPNIFAKAVFGVDSPWGLYRFEYRYTTKDGHLVYSAPISISHPWGNKAVPSNGKIFNLNNKVLGLWFDSNKKLIIAEFDQSKEAFEKSGEISLSGDYSRTSGVEVCNLGKDEFEIVLLRSDGKGANPSQNEENTQSLYDGAGAYRGTLSRSCLFSFKINIKTMKQISAIEQKSSNSEVVISGSRVVKVTSNNERLNGFVVTNSIGSLKYLPSINTDAKLNEVKYVFKNDNEILTHPTHAARAISFGSFNAPERDLVIGGERSVDYYSFSGKMTKTGAPIYSEPLKILQENSDLNSGSLTVPNLVDWNGDGTLDIVAGNSEGRLLFFKNNGTNKIPDFGYPEEIKSAGVPICFRPGYTIIQGPMEAAWGYLCPTVFDWNNDGLLDVVFSGSRAKFEVMLNRGTKTNPELEAPVTLRIDNMELPGTWRVRPGIAKINGRNAIVIMDTDDAVHLYWQVGNYSVEDGGKLVMEDGTFITHRSKEKQSLGQRGRAKFQLVDWDKDGVLDLIIGTSKRSAFPNPERGMPYARYAKNELGLQVLFMKNTGTNEKMKFAEPLQFQLNGKDLYLGTHSYGPFACELGDTTNGLNLVVGVESGKFYFFSRKDLTTIGFE
jgi:hypothetical protein